MDNPNPIYYRDLITPDDSITTLMDQLDELITKYDGAKQKIQGAAAEMAKGIQGVSGASEEQRKTIQLATEQSEKLVAEYRDITTAQWKATQAFAEAAAAKKESAQIDKLITQINTSVEGSYNRLSAQYRLNKIRLNEMSAAERQGTEAGRALEQETAAIYEEMKRLQEATGKHQLNVGNYADAAKGLKMELTSLVQQMALMKTRGEQNSEEYKQMAARAGALKDAMSDAQREVKGLSSDTRGLDAATSAASAASGGISALTSTIALMGASSETATKAQKNLGLAIGAVSGVTAVANALQKESNIMTGIRTLQTKAATKAEQLDTAAKGKNVVATTAATIAQRIFNAVAAANPYVLLAMALITVVGALVAFSAGARDAAKEQERLNRAANAQLDYLEKTVEFRNRDNALRTQALKDEIELLKARGAALSEIQEKEDALYAAQLAAIGRRRKAYKTELATLEENEQRVVSLTNRLYELEKAKAIGETTVSVEIDGRLEKMDVDKAIDTVQGWINYYGRKVKIASEIEIDEAELEKQRQIQLAQRKKAAEEAAKAAAKAETDAVRAAEDARAALIKDAQERERVSLQNSHDRQIADLNARLKTEKNLTTKARQAIRDQIAALDEKYLQDLATLDNKYKALAIQAQRETEDMQLAVMKDGAEKRRKELDLSYSRQLQDLETRLRDEANISEEARRELNEQLLLLAEQYNQDVDKLNADEAIQAKKTQLDAMKLRLESIKEGSEEEIQARVAVLEQERAIELAENAQLTEDVRKNEADINAKWDKQILETATELTRKRAEILLEGQQALAASEFALLDRNERQKSQFQLAQEKARLEQLLALDEDAGVKMTEEERQTIANTIKAMEKEAKKAPFNNIYELLGIGLDSNQQNALNTAIDSIKDSIGSLVDSWNQAAEAAVNAANAQVDAAQRTLDAEIEARNAGYANDVATAQKELDLAKKSREQALKEQEKAQKAQLAADTITQTSSLITASANIWKALSGIPVVGPGLAVAAIATMWGSFAAAKVKAAQLSKQQTEQYGEGTVELLQGGSHASGHDIDLGTKADGTRRRAEGGEFFAVINKRNSRRFRDVIPDVINSFNNGTFADRYERANAAMAGYAVGMIGGTTDVSGLEKDVAAIRQQGDETRYVDGQGNTIIRYKNLTRKIKS